MQSLRCQLSMSASHLGMPRFKLYCHFGFQPLGAMLQSASQPVMAQVVGPCNPCGMSRMELRFLTLAGPSTSHALRHLGSKLADGNSLSSPLLLIPLTLKVLKRCKGKKSVGLLGWRGGKQRDLPFWRWNLIFLKTILYVFLG